MIFLTAGHHRRDPGAVANGLKEADETIKLRNTITQDIRAKGIEVWNDMDDWDLNRTISEIRKISKPADIICDLHFNAGPPTATGCEVLVPVDANIEEFSLATDLVDGISTLLTIKNRRVKTEAESQHKRLGIMRPAGINVLIEVCFISNKFDMQAYDANFFFLADKIAGILERHSVALNVVV